MRHSPRNHTLAVLVLSAVLFCLAGCGGGDATDGALPVAYQAPTPTTSVNSLLQFEVHGLDGLLIVADANGNEFPIAADGLVNARTYRAGQQPRFFVKTQPINQHCVLADFPPLYVVGAAADVFDIQCTGLLISTAPADHVQNQVIGLLINMDRPPTGELSGLIDGNLPVTTYSRDGYLYFVVPSLSIGGHTLILHMGGHKVEYVFSVRAAETIADSRGYIENVAGELEAFYTDLQARGGGDQSFVDNGLAQVGQLRGALALATDAEAAAFASFLQANDPDTVPTALAARARLARVTASGSEYDDRQCFVAVKEWATPIPAIGVWATTLYAIAGITPEVVATFGPFGGFAAGVTGGVALYKLSSTVSQLRGERLDHMLDTCTSWDSVIKDTLPSARSLSPQSINNEGADENFRRLDLISHTPKQTRLWTKKRISPTAEHMIRQAQKVLMPVSGFFGDTLNYLYLIEFEKVLPVDDGSVSIFELISTGVPVGREFAQSGNTVTLNLHFTGDAPDEPQPYRLTFAATVLDDPAKPPVPVKLKFRGTVHGQKPVTYNDAFVLAPGEALSGIALRAEYAESFEIVSQPQSGTLTLVDSAKGVFRYIPALGQATSASFSFVAKNIHGTSAAATVNISISRDCSYWQAYQVCEYADPNGNGHIQVLSADWNPSPDGWEQQHLVYHHFDSAGDRIASHDVSIVRDMSENSWYLNGEKAFYKIPGLAGEFGAEGEGHYHPGDVGMQLRFAFNNSRIPAIWGATAGVLETNHECDALFTSPTQSRYRERFTDNGGSSEILRDEVVNGMNCPSDSTLISPLDVSTHLHAPISVLYTLVESWTARQRMQ